MTRNQAHTPEEHANDYVWRQVARLAISWAAVLILLGLGWVCVGDILNQGRFGPGEIAGLVGLSFPLSIALERGLAFGGVEHKRRYRAAFLSAAISTPLFWSLQRSIELIRFPNLAPAELYPGKAFILLVLSGSGAFWGVIFATWMQDGLWENNSPPAKTIQTEVYQRHLDVIGLPPRDSFAKRCFDLCLAGLGLIISIPVWLLCAFLIWFEDPGPLLFVKNSVGKGGLNFHQFKFRTMVRGAENATGPILAQLRDERVLFIGRILRQTALDELPQLINILLGDMSFVGPRPQRTVLVLGYLQAMPEYAQRHRVLPGLAGLAQVAGDYYLTPRQKLRFDRLYIDHIGLGFDIKLLFLAFLITFWFRWQKDWNGRLPRRLIRMGNATKQRVM
jgi:lipopolysaccharide/colanic/teichoic acid biosynthesis glycosyltransferase